MAFIGEILFKMADSFMLVPFVLSALVDGKPSRVHPQTEANPGLTRPQTLGKCEFICHALIYGMNLRRALNH